MCLDFMSLSRGDCCEANTHTGNIFVISFKRRQQGKNIVGFGMKKYQIFILKYYIYIY